MSLIRVAGLLVVLVGLFLVGVSGDNHRTPNVRNIAWGGSLMLLGAIVALFAQDIRVMTG